MWRRLGARVLAVAAAAITALGVQAMAAPAAQAASFDCDFNVNGPTSSSSSVYVTAETKCNQQAAAVLARVALYRDDNGGPTGNGTFLDSDHVLNNNTNYAWAYAGEYPCVPGDYYAIVYGAANLDGGAPDFTWSFTTPSVTLTC
ncbi:hypothetical protein LO763_27845 [Glycomyces sp. A-F 0318]|uniref:hypothetical protein n=1 Tax=Glycomyces amatae TaxID=2881355 RepID=UPI001E333DEF|nr:hypothetical protein [Glycomyces amatae]MCD0447434.1 hypothetical protein [Glycomyces amatae]